MAFRFGRILSWLAGRSSSRRLCFFLAVALCATFFIITLQSTFPIGMSTRIIVRNCSSTIGNNLDQMTRQHATNSEPKCSRVERHLPVFDPAIIGRATTGFTLITPHIEPDISCENVELFVAVVVNSAASKKKHRDLRMAIRRTWGMARPTKHCLKWKLFFALGMDANKAYNLMNRREALQYNDIIIGNFSDNYRNIPIKTFMSHFWVFRKFSSKYVLKTDDDVYVRVPRLVQWLHKSTASHHFYGGFINEYPIVFRNPNSQWYITVEQFNETRWPPFCHGAFHVLSTDILPLYFNYTLFTKKPFSTDDAYLGVIARDLGIGVTNIPGFSLTPPKTDQRMMAAMAFGDRLDPSVMDKYHDSYTRINSI